MTDVETGCRIVLMGTTEFSVVVFQAIVDGGYQVVGLVSQPDRPVGRKREIAPTPTKKWASSLNIPVFQPEKIRADYETIKKWKPDLIITCAYGQIIPQALLDLPRKGALNVHASLLPRLRGGAPIQRAIMEDEYETGVTIMKMEAKMDAGAMYAQSRLPILDSDDGETLSRKLSDLAALIIARFLPDYLAGRAGSEPQDETEVTFGYNIKPEEEKIDWNNTSRNIFNKIRALSPRPGAYCLIDGKHFKIYKTTIETNGDSAAPGVILSVKGGILVKTIDGALNLVEIQPAGGKKMAAKDYVNGAGRLLQGKRFE